MPLAPAFRIETRRPGAKWCVLEHSSGLCPRKDLARLRRTSPHGESDIVRSVTLQRISAWMRAAYDRVGWGIEVVIGITCPWDAPNGFFVLEPFERAEEGQDRGQPRRVECGVTVARIDWSGQARVAWRSCPRGAERGPESRKGRRRTCGPCDGVVVAHWPCGMSRSWPRGTSWGKEVGPGGTFGGLWRSWGAVGLERGGGKDAAGMSVAALSAAAAAPAPTPPAAIGLLLVRAHPKIRIESTSHQI